jgi:group I intron endonuclease
MADGILQLSEVSGIYVIRSLVSGRVYVGSSVEIRARCFEHRRQLTKGKHHSRFLQRHWDKHGESCLRWEVLELADCKTLIKREQHWIDCLGAANPKTGFNACPAAGSTYGRKLSEEARARMSAARKGLKIGPRSPETRLKLSLANRGKKQSAETIAKAVLARKGIKLPPRSAEARARMSTARTGIGHSAESKAKISALLIGRPVSEQTREKIRASLTGKAHPMPPWNPERRARFDAQKAARLAPLSK